MSQSGSSVLADSDSNQELLDTLLQLENPMKWIGQANLINSFLYEPNRALRRQYKEEYVDEENDKFWKILDRVSHVFRFVTTKWFSKEYNEALKPIQDVIQMLSAHDSKCRKAFYFLARVMEALLHYKLGDSQQSQLIVADLRQIQIDDIEKSYFFTLKAEVFNSFREAGYKYAVEAAKAATELNPDEAYNWFVSGKILAQMRRRQYPTPLPSCDEIHFLEQAVGLDPEDSSCVTFLAEAYFDAGKHDASLLDKGYDMIRELLNKYETLSTGTITKCVLKLLKCSNPDLKRLEHYVRHAVLDSPSAIATHQAGIFFICIKKYEESLQLFEQVVNVIPYLMGKVLALKHELNRCESNTKDYIDDCISTYDKKDRLIALMTVSEYYLLKENDPVMAASYFLDAYELGSLKGCHMTLCPIKYQHIWYPGVLLQALTTSRPTEGEVFRAKLYLQRMNVRPRDNPSIDFFRENVLSY